MSDHTIIFGASDDQILFDGSIYEQFDDFLPQNTLLECSDGTCFRVAYTGGFWRFALERTGPAFRSVLGAASRPGGEYSDKVELGPLEWVKYTDARGNIQRAYARGIVNPADEIRRLIEKDGEDAAELIQDLFERRIAAARS